MDSEGVEKNTKQHENSDLELEDATSSSMDKMLKKINSAKEKSKSKPKTTTKRTSRSLISLVELPRQILLWGDTSRGLNNQIARSALFGIANKKKPRTYVRNTELYNYGNGKITYSGPDLRQDDEDVFLQILHIARQIDLNDRIEFTGYAFLKALGWQPNSVNYERLKNIIKDLTSAVIEMESDDRLGYGSSLIQNYQFESEESGDMQRRKWSVKLDKQIVALFQDTLFTQLDWNMRMKFKRQLSKKLHSFYSTHKDPYSLKVETLHKLCRSEIEQLYTFRQELKKALNELVDTGFLASYKIDRKSDLVIIEKNQIRKSLQAA